MIDEDSFFDEYLDKKFEEKNKDSSKDWLCPYCLNKVGYFLNKCDECEKTESE